MWQEYNKNIILYLEERRFDKSRCYLKLAIYYIKNGLIKENVI